ncbi:hypothetical protein V7087_22295 [Neobacillus niacini]|uniref:hypothetical protein n=1 Tax=Neobacillus niacini TaxID=86668 RepID=UPI002FFE1A7C
MKYTFTDVELAFLSAIFQHPLPLIVDDPFEESTDKEIHKMWEDFLERFEALGLLSDGNSHGNVSVDETLTEALLGCFGAQKVISLLENEEINNVFYINGSSEVLLQKDGSKYRLTLFEKEKEFIDSFLALTCGNVRSVGNPVMTTYQEKLQAQFFEKFLELYENNDSEQLRKLCIQSFGEDQISMKILDDFHAQDGTILLTEQIGEPCMILTKFKMTDGILRFVKSIYSKKEDIVVLGQYPESQFPGVLYEWEGNKAYVNRSN